MAWVDDVKDAVGENGLLAISPPATAAAAEFDERELLVGYEFSWSHNTKVCKADR